MFRRLESGLPKDPKFPTDLYELGYFINNKDEIRSIEDPKAYFKFFLTKNDRYNCLQRESMSEVIRNIVSDRLQNLGLDKLNLPLGAKDNEAHIPIFISSDIKDKKRVIILFYEHTQDLGIFAHRIIGGKGGINEGSAVNFVKYIQAQASFPDHKDAPGVILGNIGQLRWWRRGKKAITQTSWLALPQKTAVDPSYRFDPVKNTIPGNRSAYEHVEYIFNIVVDKLVNPAAKLDVIGVSEGAVQFSTFLQKEENFNKWRQRVSAFATVATYFHGPDITNEKFRTFLADHARAYVTSDEPSKTFIASGEGTKWIPAYGCPVFSLGEPYYSETLLPKGYKVIVDWFQEVAADPDYLNPEYKRIEVGGNDDDDDDETTTWEVSQEKFNAVEEDEKFEDAVENLDENGKEEIKTETQPTEEKFADAKIDQN